MTVDDRAFLSAVPSFRGLAPEQLEQIHGRCRSRAAVKGEIIVLAEQPAEALYVVRSGRVRIFTISEDGHKEQVLSVLGPGEPFNDIAVFDGGQALANAQASVPGTRVYVVPAPVMTQLLATNPRVAANVAMFLPGQIRKLAALVTDLSFHHVTQRVARLLLEESAAPGGVALTKQEIAARTGTVREGVSRALHHLEESGAIACQHRYITVHDPAALQALFDPHLPLLMR